MKKLFYPVFTGIFILLASSMLLSQTKELTLQDIFTSRKFAPKMVYGLNPMKNGEHYSMLENDSLNVYSFADGTLVNTLAVRNNIVPEGDTVPIPFHNYTFSADEKKILIATETKPLYRYSSESEFYIHEFSTKKTYRLSKGGRQRLADFSPDGTKVAFIRGNNLVVANLADGSEIQATSDGKTNAIINGTTDWVYEEEFAITKGFQWSPDGSSIAYLRFDESRVKEFSMTKWGALYPEEEVWKYPKAGEDNSIVTVNIYYVANQKTVPVDLGPETDQYIPRIYWTKDPNRLFVFRLNRMQNHLEILSADAATGETSTVYIEDNPYYIEESNFDHFFMVDNTSFILTSERSGHYHIYQFFTDGRRGNNLTPGEWDVTGVYGFDEASNTIYFQAAISSPINREVCSTNLKGKVKMLADKPGANDAVFSSDFRYFIHTWSDANTPPVITVSMANGKPLRTLEGNQALRSTLDEYDFPPVEFFDFTTPDGIKLYGLKMLPQNLEKDKKYPVLMSVYGGPGSQTVMNRWGAISGWDRLLSQKGYMIASVDNRGTSARGEEFKKVTYLQLGKYETADQIAAAQHLGSLPYVDPDRIGIWGWSYGGYMSTLCITKGADVFKAAIAVAPVTNWRYYDNIYTERFMRKPQDNASGYDENSPVTHAGLLKGKYLLVHGTGDDNVHVQNSMDLINALIKANKQFDMFLYPNRDHGIYGGNTRMHLYTRMTDFILNNL